MATFVKAVNLGSFSAAAEVTGLSATMVGKHVQYLEARLGVRLINRTTRRQSPTEFGRAYYERCRAILEEVDAAEALASDHLNMPNGLLRVTMPGLLGRICVAPLLLDLALKHPTLRLEMSMDDKVFDITTAGYDLAVRTGSGGDQPGLRRKLLGSHRMTVCAAPEYLASKGAPKMLEDLQQGAAVTYVRTGWDPAWLFRGEDGEVISVTPRSLVSMNDLAAVTEAAVAGVGLAWIPSWLARPHLLSGALVEVLKEESSFTFDNYAVWPEVRHLPLRLQLALDVLADGLPSMLDSRS
jgi:DNA-binding transcriptional LysR family regulator